MHNGSRKTLAYSNESSHMGMETTPSTSPEVRLSSADTPEEVTRLSDIPGRTLRYAPSTPVGRVMTAFGSIANVRVPVSPCS